MLSLQLKDGEYLTIGEDIVIQVSSGSTIKLSIDAPRDMTILRGEVRERNGEKRPECVYEERNGKRKNATRDPTTTISPG